MTKRAKRLLVYAIITSAWWVDQIDGSHPGDRIQIQDQKQWKSWLVIKIHFLFVYQVANVDYSLVPHTHFVAMSVEQNLNKKEEKDKDKITIPLAFKLVSSFSSYNPV